VRGRSRGQAIATNNGNGITLLLLNRGGGGQMQTINFKNYAGNMGNGVQWLFAVRAPTCIQSRRWLLALSRVPSTAACPPGVAVPLSLTFRAQAGQAMSF
jgi:hypothetical protein